MDISGATCKANEYWTGYNCLVKQEKPGLCPLYAANPPLSGQASCQNGGNNFWYIHVGGKRIDWNKGTDAMCLSTSSKPVAWGKDPCQFDWSEAGCKDILMYAGCPVEAVDSHGNMITNK